MPDSSSVLFGPKLNQVIYADNGADYLNSLRSLLRNFDKLVMGNVISSTVSVPPGAPSNGDAYIVPAAASGIWSGKVGQLAVYSTQIGVTDGNGQTSGWEYSIPNAGWMFYSQDISGLIIYNGSTWAPLIEQNVSVIGTTIDGGTGTPTTGSKGYLQVPFDCTIQSWTILADQSGSAQITVKKCSAAGFPTTTSIVASAPPQLVAQQKNSSSTLTGWTTSISATDILEFNLDSVTTCTRITLQIQILRS